MDADRVYPLLNVMTYGNCLKVTDDAFEQISGHLHLQKNTVKPVISQGIKDTEGNLNAENDIGLFGADEFSDLISFRKISGLSGGLNDSLASSETASADEKEATEVSMSLLFEKNLKVLQHCKRVADICEAIAKAMGMGTEDVNLVKISGLMHDIGKIGISEKILNKPGKLNNDEWRQIQQHSEIGYNIVSSITGLSKIAGYILQHHERWDGKGYPNGIHSTEISLFARIIAVADAYDAMTSDRPYRDTVSREQAMTEIKNNAGSQFDPDIVSVFIEKVMSTGYNKVAEVSMAYAVK